MSIVFPAARRLPGLALLAGAWLLAGCASVTPIRQLLDDPSEYDGKTVRIEGRVEKTSDAESDAYYATRPLDSRIGAWASPQSQVIASRTVLVTNAAKFGAQYMLNPPRPPHWGGYRLVPDQWQFWQGRKSRLHDRLRYSLRNGEWVRERLAP